MLPLLKTLAVLSTLLLSGVRSQVGKVTMDTIFSQSPATAGAGTVSAIDPLTGTVFIAPIATTIRAYSLTRGEGYTVQGTLPSMSGTLPSCLTFMDGLDKLVYAHLGGGIGQIDVAYLNGYASFSNLVTMAPLGLSINSGKVVPGTVKLLYGLSSDVRIYDTSTQTTSQVTGAGVAADHRVVAMYNSNFAVLGGLYTDLYVVDLAAGTLVSIFTPTNYLAQKTASAGIICQPTTGKIFELALGGTTTTLQRLSFGAGPGLTEDLMSVVVPQLIVDVNTIVVGMEWLGQSDYFMVSVYRGIFFYRGNGLSLQRVITNTHLMLPDSFIKLYSVSKSIFAEPSESKVVYWFTFATRTVLSPFVLEYKKVSLTVYVCPINGCASCPTNDLAFKVCNECLPLNGMNYVVLPAQNQIASDSCIAETAVPRGMGKDPIFSFKRLAKCSQPGCKSCLQDSTICMDSVFQPLLIDTVLYNKNYSSIIVLFNQEIIIPIDLLSLIMWVKDEVTGDIYNCSLSSCSVNIHPKGLSVALSFDGVTILQGTFFINKAEQTLQSPFASLIGGSAYDGWPIPVRDISHTPVVGVKPSLSVTRDIAETSSMMMSIGRSFLSIFNAVANPGAAVGLDKLISEFNFLRFIGGRPLRFPDLVLELLSETYMLPFATPKRFIQEVTPWNNLQATVSNDTSKIVYNGDTCTPADIFLSNDVACNIFYNIGDEIVILWVYLGLTTAVSIFHYLFKKFYYANHSNKKAFLPSLLNSMGLSFGLKYFIAKIDAMSLEILIYSLININNYYTNPTSYVVGFYFSLIFIILYAIYSTCLIIYTRQLINRLSAERGAASMPSSPSNNRLKAKNLISSGTDTVTEKSTTKPSTKIPTTSRSTSTNLASVVSLEFSNLWLVSSPFEEYAIPSNPLFLYSPSMNTLRNALLALLVVYLPDYPVAQTQLMIFVHTLHSVWIVVANKSISRVDRVKELVECSLVFGYLLGKNFSMAGFSERARQMEIGATLAVILFMITFSSLAYSLFITVKTTISSWRTVKSQFILNKISCPPTQSTLVPTPICSPEVGRRTLSLKFRSKQAGAESERAEIVTK